MNKYEELFEEILDKTVTGKLKWKQIARFSNSDVIFSPNTVFRQFAADFRRKGEAFKLILVEKKYEDPEFDFAYDRYRPEILIVDLDGELIASLTDSVIEHKKLAQLSEIVETRSDKATKLFGKEQLSS